MTLEKAAFVVLIQQRKSITTLLFGPNEEDSVATEMAYAKEKGFPVRVFEPRAE